MFINLAKKRQNLRQIKVWYTEELSKIKHFLEGCLNKHGQNLNS